MSENITFCLVSSFSGSLKRMFFFKLLKHIRVRKACKMKSQTRSDIIEVNVVSIPNAAPNRQGSFKRAHVQFKTVTSYVIKNTTNKNNDPI